MLDFTRPVSVADFGPGLARLYANAAMRTFIATASQGLLLWSGFLSATTPKTFAGALQPATGAIAEGVDRSATSAFPWMPPASNPFLAWMQFPARDERTAEPAAKNQPLEPRIVFAAYRSAGGHASAQVIMG